MKLTLHTSNTIWISCVAWETCAITSVVPSVTLSILGTITRIFALLISAGQMVWTIRVNKTLIGPTNLVGVAFVVWWADAIGSVTPWNTESVDSTFLEKAGVLALSVYAGLVICTLQIALASSCRKIMGF